jgi:hypothetical protein
MKQRETKEGLLILLLRTKRIAYKEIEIQLLNLKDLLRSLF